MNSSHAFFWQFNSGDKASPLRSLLYLRLLIIVLVFLSLLAWCWLNRVFQYWQVPALALLAVATWSIFVLTRAAYHTAPHVELRELLIDITWVFIVVVFAGGGTNPFIYYYLVITALSAILLPGLRPWFICALCIFLYSALFVADIKQHFDHISSDYKTHLLGMWINYVSSAIVICFFMTKLMNVLRGQQESLMVSRENNLKSEQLIGLATVSAVTVHNLATPLSTLTLLVEDLAETGGGDDSVRGDLHMMKEQIQRCRSTIQELSFLAEKSDIKTPLRVTQLVLNLCEHYALHEVQRPPKFSQELNENTIIECSPLFEYALVNLINNAIESSPAQATVRFLADTQSVTIEIKNQCTKNIDELEQKWGNFSGSSKDSGLGIGSLLANSTIERQGGRVELSVHNLNRDDGDSITIKSVGMAKAGITRAGIENTEIKIATVTVNFPLASRNIEEP